MGLHTSEGTVLLVLLAICRARLRVTNVPGVALTRSIVLAKQELTFVVLASYGCNVPVGWTSVCCLASASLGLIH